MLLSGSCTPAEIPQAEVVWALGSVCALHGTPFDGALLAREIPPPCTHATLVTSARALKLRVQPVRFRAGRLHRLAFPLIVALRQESDNAGPSLGIVTSANESQAVLFRAGSNTAQTLTLAQLSEVLSGQAWLIKPEPEGAIDPDASGASRRFGFRWFVPELLKHRSVWRDVLLASAAMQFVALATPLFTQAIIDKVVVHRTQSTLVAIGVAMLIFMVFTSLLTWVRQYLVLHTGNRVDAVLGAAVWDHLLKLPARYFHHRPTGVVAARLQGVETIREFVSGAAVTLLLDLPFLVLCLAVMLWYSVTLTAVALTVLVVIGVASFLVAPLFQERLNEQFLLGARNQGFLTEHIAGFETVKSLQMEPQLRQRYAGYLAAYLHSAFETKQLGNTYHVFASTMEQAMTLVVLMLGAYAVMTEGGFTIGMLVAFQMFSGRLSQPVMRIVGLWAQFQQARLSVERLGDVMNAPVEPYSLTPSRGSDRKGRIEVQGLAFRYASDRALLFENLNLVIEPGKTVAVVGPSGTGKSTLAKLLLGFYPPTHGRILLDGTDIGHLAANELRSCFGVVPQETTLFSGTVYANLTCANPGATFEQVVQACRMAGIHEVIEALPLGYQTPLGERGAGLSGGQRQRLAIARALLKGPKVLIFDEATSALDAGTAEAFGRTVNGLRGKVTMLFITHALPRSLRIDEVIHIGAGGAHRLQALGPGQPVPQEA